MNEAEFEQALRRDGYQVVRRDMEPGHVAPEHDHAWDTRGMVVTGEFTIGIAGDSTTYREGQVFDVAAGVEHTERHGPAGGHLLVGRRKRDGL